LHVSMLGPLRYVPIHAVRMLSASGRSSTDGRKYHLGQLYDAVSLIPFPGCWLSLCRLFAFRFAAKTGLRVPGAKTLILISNALRTPSAQSVWRGLRHVGHTFIVALIAV
jgi:hypothetical protein